MAGEEVPMSLRRLIVEIDPKSVNVTRFCEEHGISTWFFWDLRRRYAANGEAALGPGSHVAHRIANKTPPEIEDLIVAKRKELVDAGLDAGAETIVWHLRGLDGLPSASTVTRILRRRGFVTPEPSKAPKHAHRSFTAERANDCWQLDDTWWQLADGTEVKILNVVDDHSRLLVASRATTGTSGTFTLETLADAAVVLGWPNRVLSDNAKAFRHVLGDALRPMGIGVGHSRPYHPQTCGKVERFHQTLKRWLRKQQPARTLAALQAQLDTFARIYNTERPHRSLGREQTPATVWAAAPKNGPADQPLGEPTHTYRGVINGGVLWAGSRWQIGIGMKHDTQRAIAIITGLNCHVFIDGRLERQLELDPTRRYQPTGKRRGSTVREPPLHM
jgi:transposase InsO family protein